MWDLLKTLYEGTEDVKQSKNLKVKKDFENCKEEYASLVNKHITIPPNKSSKVDLPKTPKPKDIDKCEACPKLHEEIVSLKNSGCSMYMTGDSSMSINFKRKERGFVPYGDNNQGLKHNRLSINQVYYNEFTITFDAQSCLIEHNTNKEIVFKQ
ncbi:hypothetical protein MTR_4g052830 [Medicago truncatula]|uniref:Uncharacterized protein n=1 Tax=Medicago truncatula TaxID=3880 RepID=A0A072UJC6_MEDTR|nr:hypothetical protein MTR_4g052830 [Medicago truncatula]